MWVVWDIKTIINIYNLIGSSVLMEISSSKLSLLIINVIIKLNINQSIQILLQLNLY
jgi:hypothetical protein